MYDKHGRNGCDKLINLRYCLYVPLRRTAIAWQQKQKLAFGLSRTLAQQNSLSA